MTTDPQHLSLSHTGMLLEVVVCDRVSSSPDFAVSGLIEEKTGSSNPNANVISSFFD